MRYKRLIGIESVKTQLLDELTMTLDSTRIQGWVDEHYPKGLPIAANLGVCSPLVLLSGDVGCGKTELAATVGTPLASELKKKIISLETPSDIRGHGLVGELSTRITEAFEQARARARQVGAGILIIDEADDLATARDQMQAHHEDRAGVNVLIKQIDNVARERVPLAVVMITNRAGALDPAVVRRASLHLRFDRPNSIQRRAIMERLLEGTRCTAVQIDELVMASEPQHGTPFSFSDLTVRLARAAMRRAWRENRPIEHGILMDVLTQMTPSPLIDPRSSEEVHSDV